MGRIAMVFPSRTSQVILTTFRPETLEKAGLAEEGF